MLVITALLDAICELIKAVKERGNKDHQCEDALHQVSLGQTVWDGRYGGY